MKKTVTRAVKPVKERKLIWVNIGFWTDGIAEKKGDIIPRHAWAGGVIRIPSSPLHGLKHIKGRRNAIFSSLAEIGVKIEDELAAHDVHLRPSKKRKKLYSD